MEHFCGYHGLHLELDKDLIPYRCSECIAEDKNVSKKEINT